MTKRTPFEKYWANLPIPRLYLAQSGFYTIEQRAEIKAICRSSFNSGFNAGRRVERAAKRKIQGHKK